jgi:hypothetical protein
LYECWKTVWSFRAWIGDWKAVDGNGTKELENFVIDEAICYLFSAHQETCVSERDVFY